jgi:hypothetical protein
VKTSTTNDEIAMDNRADLDWENVFRICAIGSTSFALVRLTVRGLFVQGPGDAWG